jgi:sensor histidine kinase YesM
MVKLKKITIKDGNIAILFSVILSLFGITTNNPQLSNFNFITLFPTWILAFSFLLISWHLNRIITRFTFTNYKKKYLVLKIIFIALLNSLFLLLFITFSDNLSNFFFAGREFNYIYLFIRGALSIAIIHLLQYALNLNLRIQNSLLQNQILKTENLRAQFEVLKQQISPHFLFNSFSSLRAMIRSSHENAELFLVKLSDLYRMLLAYKDLDAITLKDELTFIENYSFLLMARYENMLNIEIDIPQNVLSLKIPTFTLHLLVENCIKHNVVSKEKPLHVKIYYSGGQTITIENNLQRRVIPDEKFGIGQQNIINRYDLLGVSDAVQLFSDDNIYRVKIKLLE